MEIYLIQNFRFSAENETFISHISEFFYDF